MPAQSVEHRVTRLDGSRIHGVLQSISPSGEVALRDSDDPLTLDDLTHIQRLAEVALVRPAGPGYAWLRSGGTLGFTRASHAGDGGDTAIALATPLGSSAADTQIQLQHLAAIRFGVERAADDDAGFSQALSDKAANRDLVFAFDTSGEQLKRYSLLVAGVDPRGLLVDAGGSVRPLPLDRIYGVIFGSGSGAAPDNKDARGPVVQVTGTFSDQPLAGRIQGWDGAVCQLGLVEGPLLDLPCDTIREIRIDNGRVRFLSDIEPIEVQQMAALNRVQPWLRNRTALGAGLHLDEAHYQTGLCLRPRSSLTWSLDGDLAGFDVFEALVGIDERSNDFAHAVIRIMADDRIVFEQTGTTKTDDAARVSIPLEDVKRLTLEVDFGDNLDLGDHCVFVDARLRKT